MRGFREEEEERKERGGKEPVEVPVRVAQDKPGAASVAFTDGRTEIKDGKRRPKWIWVPRSQIMQPLSPDKDGNVTLVVPEWLALDRGLI